MKFVYVILVLVSLVCISQQEEIVSMGKLLQYRKTMDVYKAFFPQDFLAEVENQIPGDKNCFPLCLTDKNKWQLEYVVQACQVKFPEAMVLTGDDAYTIVRKITTDEMIKEYIKGAGHTDQQVVVDIIKEQLKTMHLEEKGLYWTASILAISRSAFEDNHVDVVVKILTLFKQELEQTENMFNILIQKVRFHFLQAVYLGGTDNTFDTFVVDELANLDQAMENFDKCAGIEQNMHIIEAAIGFVEAKIRTGGASPVLWQLCNTLLRSEQERCEVMAEEEETGPAVDLNSQMGGSDEMQGLSESQLNSNSGSSTGLSSAQQRMRALLNRF